MIKLSLHGKCWICVEAVAKEVAASQSSDTFLPENFIIQLKIEIINKCNVGTSVAMNASHITPTVPQLPGVVDGVLYTDSYRMHIVSFRPLFEF